MRTFHVLWINYITSIFSVRILLILCSKYLFWFKSYWSRDILHENFKLLFRNYMVVIRTLFTNLTLLCHICWKVCSPTVTRLFSSYLGINRATCWAGNSHSFQNTWFHSLWGVHGFTHYVFELMPLVCLSGLVWLLCLVLILSLQTNIYYVDLF